MGRDKAQQLIALLGDRAEPVLSLLSEENASYLREQKIDPQTISDDAIESIFINLQETTTDDVVVEPEIEDTIELEEEVDNDEFNFEEEEVTDTFDFEDSPALEPEEDNFKPIAIHCKSKTLH